MLLIFQKLFKTPEAIEILKVLIQNTKIYILLTLSTKNRFITSIKTYTQQLPQSHSFISISKSKQTA